MPRPVVVGVDGSPEAAAAAGWAAREALRRGLPLHLVHAWGWHPQLPVPLDVSARSRARRTIRSARDAVVSAYPHVQVTAEMITERADVALLASAGRAEMLVLGSRGHSAVAGFLLGSASLQILARAECPVVMVRAGGQAGDRQAGREVVVGLKDLERPAQALLRFAFAAADERGAAVRAVHAWDVPSDVRYGPGTVRLVDDDGTMAGRKEAALADAVRPWQRKYPGLGVIQQVVQGGAVGTLAGTAQKAAMVVVGRKVHRPVLGMRIGPVAHDVLHHVAAPVAVVPHDLARPGTAPPAASGGPSRRPRRLPAVRLPGAVPVASGQGQGNLAVGAETRRETAGAAWSSSGRTVPRRTWKLWHRPHVRPHGATPGCAWRMRPAGPRWTSRQGRPRC